MKILIPIKTNSVRCPGKNIQLLGHTLRYIEKYAPKNARNVSVITDSDAFREQSEKCECVRDYWIEEGVLANELQSVYNYINTHNFTSSDSLIILPVTQPCRDDTLIERAIDELAKSYRNVFYPEKLLVTSFTNISDRECFEIENNKFKIKDTKRTGSMCGTKSVADGAIYVTSAAFISYCVNSADANDTFWNESFISFVRNFAPLVDIDTVEELELFKKYFK